MYNPEQPIFDKQPESNVKVSIGVDEKPRNWAQTLYFAFQITLVDFTPFIWGGSFVALAGLPESVLPTMITACFLAMGITTLMQTTIGNRLPIVQGPSSALVSSMGSVTAAYGFPAMWGAVLVGGLIEGVVGAARLMSKLRKLIPPVVVGSVVTAIGFVAAKLAVTWTFSKTEPLYLALAGVAFLLCLVFKFKGKGILSQGFILVTVLIVGVGASTVTGIFDWASVRQADWFALPRLFPYRDMPGVGDGTAVAVIGAAVVGGFTGYIGSMFESVGDYAATCAACDETFKVKHIDRGIMSEGFGCIICGLFGALPTTSYTQNIGIVAATGVASRYVTRVAGGIFILYSLCPKLAALLAAIPRPIIGGVFLVSAAMIMFSGVDVITSSARTQRNTLVAGTTLSLSVMLPYFCTTGGAVWAAGLPKFLNMLVSSNIFIAVICGILLNILLNLVFKEKAAPAGTEAR